MTINSPLSADEIKLWQNLYNHLLTIDGKESIALEDGTKQLILLPMMTYTLISTMLLKLKYLPNSCFNQIAIGETPICGLRSLNRTSSSLMHKITEILHIIVDGIRKQHILSITMIFYNRDHINTIYKSYSLVFDYMMTLPKTESATSIHVIAHIIHQIEYMFNWNDPLPNDAELTFVLSALDQFDNKKTNVPSPFHFLQQHIKNIYTENEVTHLMGRLTTPDGKIWLKFLPSIRQFSGSSIHSDDLPTQANLFTSQPKVTDNNSAAKSPNKIIEPTIVTSTKLKRAEKLTTSIDSSKSGPNLLSSTTSTIMKSKKETGLLSRIKSLITPSRTPAPVTSSTPNIPDLVLVHRTSTPKPGETASRITLGDGEEASPLSTIREVLTPNVNITPTPSTITTIDSSTAATPMIANERRNTGRAPTVRGRAAASQKKVTTTQVEEIQDDENDEELFQKVFNRQRSKKSKTMAAIRTKNSDDLYETSIISSATSNNEVTFTPSTARKRSTTDQKDDDDLATEHGTPPKTPRTSRRNRIDEETTIQSTMMDTSDMHISIDSPRLLRSVTKKLQQQAAAMKESTYEEETTVLDQSKSQETRKFEEEMDYSYVSLERASIALHYSMEEFD